MRAPRTWREEIWRVIATANRPLTLREIYAAMRESELVTPRHLAPWQGDKQPRYECQIRHELTNLHRAGRVNWISQGVYGPAG